ncbi:MAG: energy transducer TonB [Desulfatiglandaceae bacterium]
MKTLNGAPLRSIPRKDRNWLLGGLIVLSVGVHILLLIRIAEVYRSDALTSIELTLRDVSRPVGRSIPRPPRRLNMPPLLKEAEPPKATERPIPSLKPPRIEPAASVLSTGPVEKISVPAVPDVSTPSIAAWRPDSIAEPVAGPTAAAPIAGPSAPVATRDGYFELVRQAIERNKQYPEAARAGRVEGRVAVQFVIGSDGNIRDVEIVKRSRSRYLNEAALDALKGAAPFPKPPKSLFKESIKLVIAIVFELR